MAAQSRPAYGSLAAFLAHYRALKHALSRSPEAKPKGRAEGSSAARPAVEEGQLLAAMEAALGALGSQERAALESESGGAAARRHRERAELRLLRELAARGIIAG